MGYKKMSELKYIIVDGLVKSGKTRLVEILSQEFDSRLILDSRENPFLEEYYRLVADKNTSLALKTQLIFLLNRYAQQQEISQKGLFQKSTLCDYIFLRDAMYANLTLNEEELDIYKKIFNIFSENVVQCDLAIYLQLSFTEMLRRIREQGTEAEKNTQVEYWRELYEAYNYFFFDYKSSPLLVVNMEKVDLENPGEIDRLIHEINTHKKGTKYYAPA